MIFSYKKNLLRFLPMTVTFISQSISSFLVVICTVLLFGVFPATAGDVKPGKYSGLNGSAGRISFKVDNKGRSLSKLNVSMFALGVDDYGNATGFKVLASDLGGKKFRLSKSGRFTARGIDANGIEYTVSGKAKGKKFKGTSVMKKYQSSYYDFLNGIYIFELVQGSREFTAK